MKLIKIKSKHHRSLKSLQNDNQVLLQLVDDKNANMPFAPQDLTLSINENPGDLNITLNLSGQTMVVRDFFENPNDLWIVTQTKGASQLYGISNHSRVHDISKSGRPYLPWLHLENESPQLNFAKNLIFEDDQPWQKYGLGLLGLFGVGALFNSALSGDKNATLGTTDGVDGVLTTPTAVFDEDSYVFTDFLTVYPELDVSELGSANFRREYILYETLTKKSTTNSKFVFPTTDGIYELTVRDTDLANNVKTTEAPLKFLSVVNGMSTKLKADSGANLIFGSADYNTLSGMGGADTIVSGSGDDDIRITVDTLALLISGDAFISGGDGTDYLYIDGDVTFKLSDLVGSLAGIEGIFAGGNGSYDTYGVALGAANVTITDITVSAISGIADTGAISDLGVDGLNSAAYQMVFGAENKSIINTAFSGNFTKTFQAITLGDGSIHDLMTSQDRTVQVIL